VKSLNRLSAYNYLAIRSLFFVGGILALWWGAVALSIFWQQSSVERIANRIIAGDAFSQPSLMRQSSAVESIEKAKFCHPSALRSATIIRLRIFEAGVSGSEHKYTNDELKRLGDEIRTSLMCLPADPFLWLVLYWAESTQNGSKPEHLDLLRMSYRLGPNEGWIAIKRSPVVFANFAMLPGDLEANAINEFLGLVRSEMYREAIAILSGPAWQVRNVILPRLESLPRRNREMFARVASDSGLTISVPGIEPPKPHP
jgi:hypothetical protein